MSSIWLKEIKLYFLVAVVPKYHAFSYILKISSWKVYMDDEFSQIDSRLLDPLLQLGQRVLLHPSHHINPQLPIYPLLHLELCFPIDPLHRPRHMANERCLKQSPIILSSYSLSLVQILSFRVLIITTRDTLAVKQLYLQTALQ